MQQRAFGIESEYSVACKGADGKFYSEVQRDSSGERVEPASEVLAEAMGQRGTFCERLKQLFFFTNDSSRRPKNFWLGSNGARFYFDNGSPEYATPECGSPREAVLHSMAGDTILEDIRQEAVRRGILARVLGGERQDLFVFKMNTHFRSDATNQKAVGCHENYLLKTMSAAPPIKNNFVAFCDFMSPFLSTRQIFDGAGAVRFSSDRGWHYVISQRIFFISAYYGTGTTTGSTRGLIQFRDDGNESPPGYQRLHIHCGDAAMSPFGKYLAVAATHLVLRAYEEADIASWRYKLRYKQDRFHDHDMLEDARRCAEDPTLQTSFRLCCGRTEVNLRAPEIQRKYLQFVKESISDFSAEEALSLRDWEVMIETLECDPMGASRELDWAIKLRYLRERCGGAWDNPKTQFASTLYHDISERGIYQRLLRGGEVRQFADPSEIAACRDHPPKTRAEFRSRYVRLLLQKPDDVQRCPNWGQFGSTSGLIFIHDPFQCSTGEGERLLEEFQEMIARREAKSARNKN